MVALLRSVGSAFECAYITAVYNTKRGFSDLKTGFLRLAAWLLLLNGIFMMLVILIGIAKSIPNVESYISANFLRLKVDFIGLTIAILVFHVLTKFDQFEKQTLTEERTAIVEKYGEGTLFLAGAIQVAIALGLFSIVIRQFQ